MRDFANDDCSIIDNQGSDTRRGAALVLINVVGQCGPILGTQLYPAGDGPRYIKGMSVCAAFMFFTTLLALGLRTSLVFYNRKLDRQYGDTKQEGDKGTKSEMPVGVENYGPNFRYVL